MKRMKEPKPWGVIQNLGVHCALHSIYTAQEQKYLMRIDAFDQKGIKEVINQQAHHGQLDPNKFEHVDFMRRIIIPYNELEPCKQHYPNLEKNLKSIGEKPVAIPSTEPDPGDCTQKILKYKTFDYLYRFVRSETRGQKKYAVLEMPFPVMQYYYNIDLGYHKLNLDVYFAFHTQAARCLYFLIEGRLRQGYTRFKAPEVLNLLTTKAIYRGIGNLCYKQLDDAEREIRNAYDLKMIDYYCIHKVEELRNPVAGMYGHLVVFDIKYRQEDINEMPAEVAKDLAMKRFSTKRLLNSEWGVSLNVADDLCSKITVSDLDAVRECFIRANNMRARGSILNPGGYIVRSLTEALKR